MMAEHFAALVIAADVRHAAAKGAVALAGGQATAVLDWRDVAQAGAHLDAAPVVSIEAEGVADAVLDGALPGLAALIRDYGLHAVVTLDATQIDIVAATMLLPNVDLLCEPKLGMQVAALALAGRASGRTGLSERVREDEAAHAHDIGAEAARIVELLTRFADRERGGGSGGHGVGDRRQSFGFEPQAVTIDAATVRQAIRGRRMRDAFLGDGLFEDPAWDMLLDLYAAHLEGRRVSVSSLCIASAVAPTTALRWIGRLTEAGLLQRRPDPRDRRRAFLALTLHALAGMEGYAAALRRAGLPFT